VDGLHAKRRRAAYDGTGGPGGSPMGLRMQSVFTMKMADCAFVFLRKERQADEHRVGKLSG
jgi:hypothetical protein